MPVKFTNKSDAQSIAQKADAPAKAKKTRRRITNRGYSIATYEKLFQYIANGETLTDACKRPGMPSPWTARRRLQTDDLLADQYKKALAIKIHALTDDLPDLADKALEGAGEPTRAEKLQAAKLKSDNVKWLAQRLLNEYAGEDGAGTVVLNITGAADIPPVSQPASMPAQLAGPMLKIVNSPKAVEGGDDA